MKKIIFVRTAPYQYRLADKSLYESFDLIGLQEANPKISDPSEKTINEVGEIIKKYKPELILSSRLIRSQGTAKLFSDSITSFSELNEIKFSMKDFSNPSDLPDNKFNHDKMNSLRQSFSKALMNNQLRENRKNIEERVANFVNFLENIDLSGNILCCSHGFIMKIFENYFISKGRIRDAKSLTNMYDWEKPTYEFLEGFVI